MARFRGFRQKLFTMRLPLPERFSDIIVIVYLIGTLYLRFQLESSAAQSPGGSIALGLLLLLFLWALVKVQVLNPSFWKPRPFRMGKRQS